MQGVAEMKGFVVGMARIGKHIRWFLCWDEVTREGVLATGTTFSEKEVLPKAFKTAKKLFARAKLPAEASAAISSGRLGDTRLMQYEPQEMSSLGIKLEGS
jgi:hypothetical protein